MSEEKPKQGLPPSSSEQIKPGDGIRSMKTSGAFRALNFELYARPNKVTMALGLLSFSVCVGYIAYMNYNFDKSQYYPATLEDGSVVLRPKTNKWDD